MADPAVDRRPSADDQAQVASEIQDLVGRERSRLTSQAAAFRPRSRGWALPLGLNLGALAALAATALVLAALFGAAESTYVLKAAQASPKGADIVSALLAEAQGKLDKQNQAVTQLESQATDLDKQLAALGPGDESKKTELLAQKAAVTQKLTSAKAEQDKLNRQVAYQAKTLEQTKAAEAGATVSAASDPLQELKQAQELQKLYDQNQQATVRTLGAAIEQKRWDQALALVRQARGAADAWLAKAPESEKLAVGAQRDELAATEALLAAAQAGWPAATVVEAAAPAPADQSGQVADLKTRLQAAEKRLAGLDQVGQESAVQVQAILQSLNTSLGSGGSAKASPLTLENLPIRLKELQTVAAQVQEIQGLAKKQASELEALRAQPTGGSGQLTAALGNFDKLLAVTMPGQPGPTTAENLPARIDALQKKLLAGQDNAGVLAQQAAALALAQTQLKTLQTDRDRLSDLVNGYTQAGQAYQIQAAAWGTDASSADRQKLRAVFSGLQNLFKTNAVLAAQFPDYGVFLATLVENLVTAESDRAKALAEDKLLALMSTTTSKLGDEQLRMLASADHSKDDTRAVLTSLIKEIDQTTSQVLKERGGKPLPRALGSVVVVKAPTLTVRRAARFELFRVRRVFISRILASGDRIPIAEADIVASSGEDLFLKVTSTIAPSIFPERNDLVFVEM